MIKYYNDVTIGIFVLGGALSMKKSKFSLTSQGLIVLSIFVIIVYVITGQVLVAHESRDQDPHERPPYQTGGSGSFIRKHEQIH